ncbi:MAG: hypothetical protein U0414_05355 [Polyangiaceae bacterium]
MKNAPSLRAPSRALLGAGIVALTLAPTGAHALDCDTLPNPVYVTGSGKVILAGLGKALAASGITLVYKLQGSCLATDAILAGTKVTSTATDQAIYWDSTSELKCDLPVGGVVATLGISDVFPETCFNLPNGLPSNVHDFFGPVEAYQFVVPKASTQQSISHDAAYFVFGFGKDSGVAPWTDEAFMFVRNKDSGTQQMLGAGIGVPPDKWKGTDAGSSGAIVTAMQTSTNVEATIGILTAEVAGANRASLNALAYQDVDQTCGYWPDSTPTSNDKQNVRDGHYPLWGPLHLLTQVDGMGYPLDPTTKDVVAYITGTKDILSFDLIQLLEEASIIPTCAMTVQRTSELGALSSLAPNRACGCRFDELSTGTSSCQKCMSPVDCPASAPACNYGFCEMQ